MSQEHPIAKEQLERLWHDSERDLAVAFLKRTVRPDMTLEDLITVLEFPQVRPHLRSILLRGFINANKPAAPPRIERGVLPTRQDLLERKREVVLRALRRAPTGLTSPELGEALEAQGHVTVPSRTYTLLRAMQQEGLVVSEGDKVKTWFLPTTTMRPDTQLTALDT